MICKPIGGLTIKSVNFFQDETRLGMDFFHPRIRITFHPKLRSTANELATQYRAHGAIVTLATPNSIKSNENLLGKLVFFDKNQRVVEIAVALAKSVSRFHHSNPEYSSVKSDDCDFHIYLLAADYRQPSKKKPDCVQGVSIKTLHPEREYRQCEICNWPIRIERWEKHVKKAHLKGSIPCVKPSEQKSLRRSSKKVIPPVRKRAPKLVYKFSPPAKSSETGRLIGQPRLDGPKSPMRIKQLRRSPSSNCRICGGHRPMSNSGECYSCNPK